ncbi:hypothetical protein F8388_015797 [Cannabis sativa]|uniref:Uncharacterized protein n=1 Tax=Cannabis sativa TaxID=3483 RepID=A0A7J6FIX4_CANSA|nr:hypothetical protein F8388_015797 [Cannabis sativa]
MGVVKETGIGWIVIEKKVHIFVVWDGLHSEVEIIYEVLDQLFRLMTDEGYVTNKNRVQLDNFEVMVITLPNASKKMA